jgi:MFS family permease
LRLFLTVWIGQVVSVVGSGLTAFGLGVWVLERTGSATQYSIIAVAAILPTVLVAPIAGVYVDRWDRRLVMLVSDLVAGLSTLCVALLLSAGQLEVWHILVTTTVASIAGAFQRPAYAAATTLLVPKEQIGKAAGLAQLGEPLSTVLAPILAGGLIGWIGLSGIIVIDFATFLFAVATLAFVRFPGLEPREESAKAGVLEDLREGWAYVARRAGLMSMMLYFLAVNFVFGFIGVLYAPYVLSFGGPSGLGVVMSVAGIGGIAGAVVMGVWGGPAHRARAVLWLGVGLGVCVAATGMAGTVLAVSIAAFVTMVVAGVDNAVSQALWQVKTDPAVQGRVFAMRGTFAMVAMPVAYLLAGPLADRVFSPGLMEGGALAGTLGAVVGTGPGRGIGAMFLCVGALAVAVSLAAFAVRPLRRLDEDTPDALA